MFANSNDGISNPCMSNRKLEEILNHADKSNFTQLLTDSLILELPDHRSISIVGWQFDTSCTLYSSATSNETKSGWDFLLSHGIPLDTFARAFLINSVDDYLNPEKPKESGEWIIDIKLEPVILEMLRLSLWIDKSKIILSFNNKFTEIKEQLVLGGKDELVEDFAKRCKLVSKLLLNSRIPRWERIVHKTNFLNELNRFRIVVSSFVSEIMIGAILQMEGFGVEFQVPRDDMRACDMIVNSFKVEVKSIFDQIRFSKTEDTLCKEPQKEKDY